MPKAGNTRYMRPGSTPEARESQMIALAVDCAERQMREGTASATVICHYLKLGTERERLEREQLRNQNKLIEAKTKNLQSIEETRQLLDQAMRAFTTYKGTEDDSDAFDPDEEQDPDIF